MLVVSLLVFLAIFAIATLLLSHFGADAAEEKKQTQARLEAMTMPGGAATEAPVEVRKRDAAGSLPFLTRWLSRTSITPKLRDLLSQSNLELTPARLVLITGAFCVIPGALIQLRTGVTIVAVIGGCLAGMMPAMYVLVKRRKRFDQFEQGLPAALDQMTSALRSGHSLISAMNLVARECPDPVGREFRICFDEQNYGLELRSAMLNLARRIPIQDVRIVMTAILIQKETGGNLAEVLDKCGYVIRERFRLKKEISTKTAQGRLTGWILTAIPLALGFLMYLLNPEHVSVLWTRPLGVKMLYASAGMTLTGGYIIRKIVRIRV
jgi:tight adherence protein B